MFFDIDCNIGCPWYTYRYLFWVSPDSNNSSEKGCPWYTYRYLFWVFADSYNSSVKGCPGIAEQPFTGVCLV